MKTLILRVGLPVLVGGLLLCSTSYASAISVSNPSFETLGPGACRSAAVEWAAPSARPVFQGGRLQGHSQGSSNQGPRQETTLISTRCLMESQWLIRTVGRLVRPCRRP